MAARGLLGAGDLYIARFDGGVRGAWTGPFEATRFAIQPQSELRRMTSKGRSTYGQVIESVSIPGAPTVAVTLAEVNRSSIAIATMGTAAAATQAAGSVTGEALAGVSVDVWLPLSKGAVSGVRVYVPGVEADPLAVPPVVGTPDLEFEEGEDYIVNAAFGWIKVLQGGAIDAGDDVSVDFNHAALDQSEISGSTVQQLRLAFKFDGKNMVDDSPLAVTVHEAILSTGNELDFLSDEFATIELTGEMKTPAGFISPFTIRT